MIRLWPDFPSQLYSYWEGCTEDELPIAIVEYDLQSPDRNDNRVLAEGRVTEKRRYNRSGGATLERQQQHDDFMIGSCCEDAYADYIHEHYDMPKPEVDHKVYGSGYQDSGGDVILHECPNFRCDVKSSHVKSGQSGRRVVPKFYLYSTSDLKRRMLDGTLPDAGFGARTQFDESNENILYVELFGFAPIGRLLELDDFGNIQFKESENVADIVSRYEMTISDSLPSGHRLDNRNLIIPLHRMQPMKDNFFASAKRLSQARS